MRVPLWRALFGALLGTGATGVEARAQIDYRNLDDDRPSAVEDAYPIERYAFEVLGGYRFERARGGARHHLLLSELAYGAFPGFAAGVKLLLAREEDPGSGRTGLAGLRVFTIYNLTTERPALPGLSVRADAALPVGALGGGGPGAAVKLLATRSYGRNRLHGNAGWRVVSPDDPGSGEPLPRWFLGLAVDRTLIRSSTLLIASVYAAQADRRAPTALDLTLGFRRQVTPTFVFDAGLSRGLRPDAGPTFALTLGLSHGFGVAALMPGGSP